MSIFIENAWDIKKELCIIKMCIQQRSHGKFTLHAKQIIDAGEIQLRQ